MDVRQVKKREHMNGNGLPFLHENLVIEILLRLPASSLKESCVLVCKEWRNIIRSPTFIKELKLHSTDGILQRIITDDGERKIQFIDLKALESSQKPRVVYDIPENFPEDFVIESVCNRLYLWRDSVTQIRYVTDLLRKKTIEIPLHDSAPIGTDLVYVPSTKTYKVVNLHTVEYEETYVFQVFSMGSHHSRDSWRRVVRHVPEFQKICDYQRTLVLGILYVNTSDWNPTGSRRLRVRGVSYPIISFDAEDESTGILMEPPGEYIDTWLINMGNQLSFIGHSGGFPCDVWILKEKRWIKEFRIEAFPVSTVRCSLRIFGSFHDGEVVLFEGNHTGRLILMYYVKTRVWKVSRMAKEEKAYRSMMHYNGTLCDSFE